MMEDVDVCQISMGDVLWCWMKTERDWDSEHLSIVMVVVVLVVLVVLVVVVMAVLIHVVALMGTRVAPTQTPRAQLPLV